MSAQIPMSRTAVIMLASGRSRRFGWRDKLLQDVGGRPLLEHAATTLSGLGALCSIAVCASDHPRVGEILQDRFVIAVNKHSKEGMGRSIATGMDVALQFKPDAVVVAMADMPFVEPWIITDVVQQLGAEGANIAHAGVHPGARPPSAFDRSTFDVLRSLRGDDGARKVMQMTQFRAVGVAAPAPILVDVDTPEQLELARRQMEVRDRYLKGLRSA
jgi:CTP:molybdopterin cytidylyltransferase MocA